jgi:hypothetical protein
MRLTSLVIASCVLVTFGRVGAAQQKGPAPRRVSATIGISKGAGALTCPFCTNEGKGGLAGLIGVERSMRPGLRVGLEADWWMHSDGDASRSVLAAVPVAHLYPKPNGSFFFKLGVGIARYSASSDEEELRTTAVAGVVGVGHEIRISGRNVVIPYLSYLSGHGGTIRLNGAQVTPLGGLSLLQYGLALSKR